MEDNPFKEFPFSKRNLFQLKSLEQLFLTPSTKVNLDVAWLKEFQNLIIKKSEISIEHEQDKEESQYPIFVSCNPPPKISDLEESYITRSNYIPKQTGGASFMLQIKGNNFPEVRKNIFDEEFRNLVELDLSNNQLRSLHSDSFEHLTSLRSLSLAHNLLTSVNIMKISSKVITLNLEGNQITSLISNNFSSFPSLKFLNLNQNLISEIQYETFSSNPDLEELHLSQNHLSTLFCKFPTSIRSLNLSRNSLPRNFLSEKSFEMVKLSATSLHYLDLSHNKIEIIYENSFANFPQKENSTLLLRSNLISTIESGAFSGSALTELDLSFNLLTSNLKSLPLITFKKLPSLTNLNLIGNQLTTKTFFEICDRIYFSSSAISWHPQSADILLGESKSKLSKDKEKVFLRSNSGRLYDVTQFISRPIDLYQKPKLSIPALILAETTPTSTC